MSSAGALAQARPRSFIARASVERGLAVRSHSRALRDPLFWMGAIELECAQAQGSGRDLTGFERRSHCRKRVKGAVIALPGRNDVRHCLGDFVCRVVLRGQAEQRIADGYRWIRDPIAIVRPPAGRHSSGRRWCFDLLTRCGLIQLKAARPGDSEGHLGQRLVVTRIASGDPGELPSALLQKRERFFD